MRRSDQCYCRIEAVELKPGVRPAVASQDTEASSVLQEDEDRLENDPENRNIVFGQRDEIMIGFDLTES